MITKYPTKYPTKNPTKNPTKESTKKKTNNINEKETMWQNIWRWGIFIGICYLLFLNKGVDYAEKRRYERAQLENSLYRRFLDAIIPL